MADQSIIVRHNVEMGHRLSQQPDSKCFHLHGHSWWVELELIGPVSELGMVLNLNFADIKQLWRTYLDKFYDHHLCLNMDDPLIQLLNDYAGEVARTAISTDEEFDPLPTMDAWGIVTVPFDPTVENMAREWGRYAEHLFTDPVRAPGKVRIKVQEAATNAATWRSY